MHRKQQGKRTIGKGQKKPAQTGEKSSKVDSKEGKVKAKAPRGLSRALTKLAKQYVYPPLLSFEVFRKKRLLFGQLVSLTEYPPSYWSLICDFSFV